MTDSSRSVRGDEVRDNVIVDAEDLEGGERRADQLAADADAVARASRCRVRRPLVQSVVLAAFERVDDRFFVLGEDRVLE